MLTTSAAVGAGTVAGVFFAFSTFVMPALRRMPPAEGIRAMQAINTAAPRSPVFMTALFGSAALAAGVGAAAAQELDEPSGIARLAGASLYLASVVVTVTHHVPRNNRLALVDPSHAASPEQWRDYLAGWTAWNHARTLLSVASCIALASAAQAG
jgi:uncharacterized membrane protein